MRTVIVHRIETGRHLMNLLHADGLVEHATPPGIKGPCHHLVVRTHSRRSQEERILTADAAEVDGKRGRVRRYLLRIGSLLLLTLLADSTEHLVNTDRPVIVNTCQLGTLQVSVSTVLHPIQRHGTVVKADSSDGTGRVATLTSLRTRSLMTQQATVCLFIDVQSAKLLVLKLDLVVVQRLDNRQ